MYNTKLLKTPESDKKNTEALVFGPTVKDVCKS